MTHPQPDATPSARDTTQRPKRQAAPRPAVNEVAFPRTSLDPDGPGQAAGIDLETRGRGRPLLLIHGTGGSRLHWEPVIELLERHRRLVLPDLPGHGRSLPLPPNVPHTPPSYAARIAEMLTELGLEKLDVCGHSAGAWTALELAKLGRTRSVLAIAPAGLWAKRDPWTHFVGLGGQYVLGRALAPLAPALLASARGRKLLMQRNFARPQQIPPGAAVELARTFAKTASLPVHLRETRRARFQDGRGLDLPLTVAWGDRERSIPAKARLKDELPAHTHYVTLENCGHMAMWDDPDCVAELILQATAPSSDADCLHGAGEQLV